VCIEVSPPLCASGAIALGRGKHCAGVRASIAPGDILDREVLPINPYGEWNKSMLADEDLANDVRLRLQFRQRIPMRRAKPVALLRETKLLCYPKIDRLEILYGSEHFFKTLSR
jgi:hypothetical protein